MAKKFNPISNHISTKTAKNLKKVVVANALLNAEEQFNNLMLAYCEAYDSKVEAEEKAAAEAKIANDLATVLSEAEALEALSELKRHAQYDALFAQIVAKAEAKAKKKAAKAEARAKKAEARAKKEAEKAACRKAIEEKLNKLREAAAARVKAKKDADKVSEQVETLVSKNAVMTRDVMGKKLAAKENVAFTKIALVDRCGKESTNLELLKIDDSQRYAKEIAKWNAANKDGYYPLLVYGRNGIVETTVLASKSEYMREITDNYEAVSDQHVLVNTDSGYVLKFVENYTEDVLQLDMGNAFKGLGDSVVVRYVKDNDKAIPRKCEFNQILCLHDNHSDAHNLYYFYDSKIKKWIRIDGKVTGKSLALDIAITKKNFEHGVLTAAQVVYFSKVEKYSVDTYTVFNASPSSLRQDSCLFTKSTGLDSIQDIEDFMHLVYDRTTSGLFSYMEEKCAYEVLYIKAVKDVSRLSLNITDAFVYPQVVDAFCRFNSKYVTLAYEDNKPVEFADGLFLVNYELLNRIYLKKFGHIMPESLLKQNEGNISQMRIGCTIKGLALMLSLKSLGIHLETVRSGLLSLGNTGRIILIKNEEDEKKYRDSIQKYDMVFSGPAYNDIEPDEDGYVVTDEAKIKLLFERVIVVGDMNAYKYSRNLTTAQDANVMAFPPSYNRNGKINLSNQFCTSIMWMDKVNKAIENVKNEGMELLLSLVKEGVQELLDNLKKNAEYLTFSDLANFDSFAESCIRQINAVSAMQDPFVRNQVIKDLVTTVSKMINNMNIRVSGFIAVGIVDIGLLLYGVPVLEAGQMFSGNVKADESMECVVMRSPKISRMEYVILTDIGKFVLKNQIKALIWNKKLPKSAIDVLWPIVRNIRGRIVMLPSFRRILVNLLGGSDFDGDIYAIIIDQRIVVLLKGREQFGIDYGSFDGTDEKVVLHVLRTDKGYISPARVIRAYFETGNPKIGVLAHMNLVIISLLEMIERGKLTDENLEEVFYRNVKTYDDDLESMVFEPGQPEYESFFKPEENDKGAIVLADANTIDVWCKYCSQHSVTKVASLYELLLDVGVANSSIMGRDVDSAKNLEKIYVAFCQAFEGFESAYWKGSIGITDVEIKYIAETEDEMDKVELGECIEPVIHTIQRGPVEMNIMVLDDNANEFKNRAAALAVDMINDWLRDFDKELEENNAKGLTSNITAIKIDLVHKSLENIAYINSGIMAHRRDARNDIAPYITDTIRCYTRDLSMEKQLGMALALSYRDKKNTEDKSELDLGMTRFYTRLNAEIALIALRDRFKTTSESNMLIKDRIHTTCDYMFFDGEELVFENGIAVIDGGYAICDSADGKYAVSVDEKGYPYAVADLEQFLEAKREPQYKLALNVFNIEKYGNALFKYINSPEDADRYHIVSEVQPYGVYLYKVDKETLKAQKLANISVTNLKFRAKEKDKDGSVTFKDAQLSMLDNAILDIDMFTSYVNSKGTKYHIICVSYVDGAPEKYRSILSK